MQTTTPVPQLVRGLSNEVVRHLDTARATVNAKFDDGMYNDEQHFDGIDGLIRAEAERTLGREINDVAFSIWVDYALSDLR